MEEANKNEMLENKEQGENKMETGNGGSSSGENAKKEKEDERNHIDNPNGEKEQKTDEEKEAEYRQKIYNELGLKSDDKASIEMFKKFLKLQEGDNKEVSAEAEKAKNIELENKLAIAEFKAEVLKAGVRATYVDDAVTLILSKKTGDNFKVNEVIKEFKTKYPVWFAEESRDGTGGTLKSGQNKDTKDSKSLGSRLAAMRHKPEGRKSYFSN